MASKQELIAEHERLIKLLKDAMYWIDSYSPTRDNKISSRLESEIQIQQEELNKMKGESEPAVQESTQSKRSTVMDRKSIVESLGSVPAEQIAQQILGEEKPTEKKLNPNKVDLGTQPKEGTVTNIVMDTEYAKVGSLVNELKKIGATDLKMSLQDDKAKITLSLTKTTDEVKALMQQQQFKGITYSWGSK